MEGGGTVAAVSLAMAGIVSGLIGAVVVGSSFFMFSGAPQSTAAEIEAVQQLTWGTLGGGSCCCLSSVVMLGVAGVLFARRKSS